MVLSQYRTGKYVELVFKQYDVIDDIKEVISRRVHNDKMKVICWVINNTLGRKVNVNNYTDYEYHTESKSYQLKDRHYNQYGWNYWTDLTIEYRAKNNMDEYQIDAYYINKSLYV